MSEENFIQVTNYSEQDASKMNENGFNIIQNLIHKTQRSFPVGVFYEGVDPIECFAIGIQIEYKCKINHFELGNEKFSNYS